MIFDTDILIWHFRGNSKASRAIQEVVATGYEKVFNKYNVIGKAHQSDIISHIRNANLADDLAA